MREEDYWQDQFAKDGTLSPLSTADTRTANLEVINPPKFGDKLLCRTNVWDPDAMVYFVFRITGVPTFDPLICVR
jgi:hypothetical protein